MKKFLAVALLLLLACGIASASENNWRFYLLADDGAHYDSAAAMTIGVYSGTTRVSLDGNYSDQLGSDTEDRRFVPMVGEPTMRTVDGVFGGMAWVRDVKSPRAPWTPIYSNRKVWDLRVAGMSEATTDKPIRLQFLTINTGILPPGTISGKQATYYLKMVDNKEVVGAYANGTTWSIPIPTAHVFNVPYFTLTLPILNTTGFTEGNLLNEGYKMEFWQEAVPEPSSVMALGAGLITLAGFGLRRRRG